MIEIEAYIINNKELRMNDTNKILVLINSYRQYQFYFFYNLFNCQTVAFVWVICYSIK